ncbi:Uncharacterised protein [Streptococcus pneumoniae]|nr:Uncharacterised protein [Streptococcus pneumoniae]
MVTMLALVSLIKNSLRMNVVVTVVMYLLPLMTMMAVLTLMVVMTMMAVLTLMVVMSMMAVLTLMVVMSMMAMLTLMVVMMTMVAVNYLRISTYSSCYNTYSRYRKSCLYSSNERWKCSWYAYWYSSRCSANKCWDSSLHSGYR